MALAELEIGLRNSQELQPYIVRNVSRPSPPRHLGSGSYGSVEEFLVGGLKCAGKTLHRALFSLEVEVSENISRKFMEECRLMSDLRHPNIVQFLGIYFRGSGDEPPVVLMEYLPMSLERVIETYAEFPLSLKQSVMRDVACGMSYLHGLKFPVIHRDLTATNVLLDSAMVAKITDFGNSRMVTISPDQLHKTMTNVPGTPVYLPPEAFDQRPNYDEKLDVFSFGQLSLFTVVQEFPSPSAATVFDSSTNTIIAVSEIQRRQSYIDKLDPIIPSCPEIKEIILLCLDNDPQKRPNSSNILSVLEEVCGRCADPLVGMSRLELHLALQEQKIPKTRLKTQDKVAVIFESAYHAKSKVLEAREEEVSVQAELIVALQEESKSKDAALKLKEREIVDLLKNQEAALEELHSRVALLEVQRDTLSKNCATKQKVISAKEEELEGLNNIVEEMATQKTTSRDVEVLRAENESLQHKLHISKLEIDGWERLCLARNQQLEDINKEKRQLEEQIQKKLEELEQDIIIIEEDSESELTTWKSTTSEFEVLSESSSVEQSCGENESTKPEDDLIHPESAPQKTADDIDINLNPESMSQERPISSPTMPPQFVPTLSKSKPNPSEVSDIEEESPSVASPQSAAPTAGKEKNKSDKKPTLLKLESERPASAPTKPTISKPESKPSRLTSTSPEPSDFEEEPPPAKSPQLAAPTTGKEKSKGDKKPDDSTPLKPMSTGSPSRPTSTSSDKEEPPSAAPTTGKKKNKGDKHATRKTKKKKSSLTSFSRPQSYKVVVIGDGATGKTCLLITYTTNAFPQEYVPTVFDNYSAKVSLDGEEYHLHLWDTAGQDDYDRLRPLSYPQTDCFVVLFSVDNPGSLHNVEMKWHPEITDHDPKVPFVLVSNKQDLRHDPCTIERLAEMKESPVTYDQGKTLAEKLGAAAYVDCSAKTKFGVREIFENVVSAILDSAEQRDKTEKGCVIQ